ncbi:MAG: lipid A biosynthesis lauroyl acyltransferase [Bdellovibrio sp.]|nr:lipid A biosynthesis lauroyl acyltransferase [Bdellovibrio sp.]
MWSFLPYKLNLYFGNVLAFLWIDIFQIRKDVIYSNLDIVFPNKSFEEKKKIARGSMQSMGRNFFDTFKIPSVDLPWIEKQVRFHGLDHYEKALAEGKGILFLSLHLGSGDLGAAVLAKRLKPIYIISKRFRNQFIDTAWFALRGASKTQFIDAHGKKNAFEILGALKKNFGVVFVLDQFMGKPFGVLTSFFGKKTGTAYGLALFAKKTQAPVVPIYTHWGKDGMLNISFGERIDLSPFVSDDDETYKCNVTNRFNHEIEKIILQHPEHWMWVHRRWKDFE